MDGLTPSTVVEAWATLVLGPGALATARLLGIFLVAPLFGAGLVPWRIRILLAVLLGAIAGTAPISPPGRAMWPLLMIGEFGWGAMIGLGLCLFAGGLRFAGELIDTQLGTGDVLDHDPFGQVADGPLGPSARLLSGLAVVTVLFAITPAGRMPVLESILRGFEDVPPGRAFEAAFRMESLAFALQTASELALRAALPIVSTLAVAGWAQSFLARAVPQMPATSAALAIRPLLGLTVLCATFGGVSESAAALLSRWMEA